MAIPGHQLNLVVATDSFKQWADKCNSVVNALNSTSFLTSDDLDDGEVYLTAYDPATITGSPWNFNSVVNFSGRVSYTAGSGINIVSGPGTSFTVGKASTFSNDFTLSRNSQDPVLKFQRGLNTATVTFDTTGSEFDFNVPITTSGITSSGTVNTVGLVVTGTDIEINSVNYTWPSTLVPTVVSDINRNLIGVNASGDIEIEDRSLIISEAVSSSISAINTSNFVLPVELIPVGTRVSVDYKVIESHFQVVTGSIDLDWPEDITATHPTFRESNKYPTWLVCDGSIVSYDRNDTPDGGRFEELVKLLDPSQGGDTGSAYLPDAFDETKDLGLTTDNGLWHVVGDTDEVTEAGSPLEGGALGAGEWDVNLNFLSDGAGSGWSYEALPGPNGGGKNIWNNTSTFVTGWQALDINLADYGSLFTLPSNVVGVEIQLRGSGNGIGDSGEMLMVPPGSSMPPSTQLYYYDPVGVQAAYGYLWVNYSSNGNGAGIFNRNLTNLVPITASDNTHFRVWYRKDDDIETKLFIDVKGFWVEGGTDGSTYVSVASLNQKFHVPKNNFLHFKTDNRIESQPPSWDVSYAIKPGSDTPTRGGVKWKLWKSYTGVPIPGDYSGTARRAGDGAYLIKAEPDSASNFYVGGGNGISITPTGPQSGNLLNAFDIYGTLPGGISLNINTDQLKFTGAALDINYSVGNREVWGVANNSTIVKRTPDGQIRGNDPVDLHDLTTKRYVDDEISGLQPASTYAINTGQTFDSQSSDDIVNAYQNCWTSGFNRGQTDLAIISKYRMPMYFGNPQQGESLSDANSDGRRDARHYKARESSNSANNNRHGDPLAGIELPILNSPLGDQASRPYGSYGQNAKISINQAFTQFIIDEDDIIYGMGDNYYGVIGDALEKHRGQAYFRTGTDYDGRHTGTWMNDSAGINDTLNSNWMPAMVPNGTSSSPTSPNAYTQVDWFAANQTMHNIVQAGIIVKTKDDIAAGTRGVILQAGRGAQGQFADGNKDDATRETGPLQWSATGPWRNLWRTYATSHTSTTDQNNTFHKHLPGTGHATEWYIEKCWYFGTQVYTLVRRNDDLAGTDTELWVTGKNTTGNLGSGTAIGTGTTSHCVRVCNATADPNVLQGSISTQGDGFYTTSVPHGLDDWGILIVGSTKYIVRLGSPVGVTTNTTGRGNVTGSFNHDNLFRLYRAENVAGINDAFNTFNNAQARSVSLQPSGFTHFDDGYFYHPPVKGIKSLACHARGEGEGTMVAVTHDGDVYGWGRNNDGGTGLSAFYVDYLNFAERTYTHSPGNHRAIAVIGGGASAQADSRGGNPGKAKTEEGFNYYVREYDNGGRRELWGCGSHFGGHLPGNQLSGWSNPDTQTGHLRRAWTVQSESDESVEKVFGIGGGHACFYVGVPTGSGNPVLKVAGVNGEFGLIGLGFYDAADMATSAWTKVHFKENPMNIVKMTKSGQCILALAKDDGDESLTEGKLYVTGQWDALDKDENVNIGQGYFRQLDNLVIGAQ